jgi:hypothetical protein
MFLFNHRVNNIIKLHFWNIVSFKRVTSYLSSWAIAKIAKQNIYPRVIQGIGLVILGNPYLGKSHQIMQYIQKVNIIICIIWVQIEYAEGESTCLARKCPVGRPRMSLVTTTVNLYTGGPVSLYTGGSRNRLWCTACDVKQHHRRSIKNLLW